MSIIETDPYLLDLLRTGAISRQTLLEIEKNLIGLGEDTALNKEKIDFALYSIRILRQAKGLCLFCGGEFSGVFKKNVKHVGK